MTNKFLAMQLCSQEFLINFSGDFLNKFELKPWTRDFGPKDCLPYAEADKFGAIFVDLDLSYSVDNIRCWTRLLKAGGVLVLEATPYYCPEYIEQNNSESLQYLKESSSNKFWLFVRKKQPGFVEILNEVLQAVERNAEPNDILKLLDKLEQRDALLHNFAEFTIIKARIYQKYGLTQLALRDIQHYADRGVSFSHLLSSWLGKLTIGEYGLGFKARQAYVNSPWYDIRAETEMPSKYSSQEWKGESLKNKTLLVASEAGLGDELMFSQLAYYLKQQRVKKLIFMTQPPNVELLKTHPDIDQVVSTDDVDKLPEFDYFVYPHDILVYSKLPFKEIPKRHPFLTPSKDNVAKYAKDFSDSEKLKIGIVWRGNPTHENDKARSIHDLGHIESLFKMNGIDWYCFQKDCNEQELNLLNKYQVPHITKNFNALIETAAALQHLDYLITVDTSVAHVAGAMGVNTLLLIPNCTDWRWGLGLEHNLWYPSVNIIRNPMMFTIDWTLVIQKLQIKLNELVLQYN